MGERNVDRDSSQGRYILAIDLGTSGPKVGLVSAGGEVLGSEWEPTRFYLLPGGGAEQRTEEWWEAICKAVRRLVSRFPAETRQIAALSCTTQWSGTVAVDRDGRPLANAIIWMDSRGAPYIRQIMRERVRIEGYGVSRLLAWLRRTGGVPGRAGKDPIAHILYLKHERPELYQQAYKFLEPKDYLNLRLTGIFAASFDSIVLHWLTDNRDIYRVRYDDRLVKYSTIEREKLPELRPAASILGPLVEPAAGELGLPPGIPVVAGSPDVQTATVGSGAVEDFAAHLYIGTSSWLTCHVPYKKTDLLHNMASLPSAIPDRYLVTNEQELAGGCLDYLIEKILYPQDELTDGPPSDVYERLNRLAGRAPAGSGKLIFTPWLYGERTPADNHRARGGFFNQSLQTGREHLVRAVFEGVAYNSRWLLASVEGFLGRRLEAVTIAGGGAASDLWCQIQADVLNRPIRQVSEPRLVNLRGAAFLALVALGWMSFSQVPGCVPIARTYAPNPAHRAIYDELYREYTGLYRRSRAAFARLNRDEAG